MSIIRCECGRMVDTDFEEVEEVEDAVLCLPCYQDFCEKYGEQEKQWWAQQNDDEQWIQEQQNER